MTENPGIQSDERLKKQAEFLERAQKGVLKYLLEKGGSLPMGELHDYSLTKYLIQHQRFSEMMEFFVSEGLVHFDWETKIVAMTAKGQEFVQ